MASPVTSSLRSTREGRRSCPAWSIRVSSCPGAPPVAGAAALRPRVEGGSAPSISPWARTSGGVGAATLRAASMNFWSSGSPKRSWTRSRSRALLGAGFSFFAKRRSASRIASADCQRVATSLSSARITMDSSSGG
jgi:hypothetical protein